MVAMIDEIKVAFWNYCWHGIPLVFLLIAIIVLLVRWEQHECKLFWYGVITWIMLMLPGITTFLLRTRADSGDSWMAYAIIGAWVLPAYMIAEWWIEQPKGKKQISIVVFTFFLLQVGMGLSYSGKQFEITKNWNKVSKESIQVADALSELPMVVLLAPPEVAEEIREYNSQISVYYGTEFVYNQTVPEYLMDEAQIYGCNCVVASKEYVTEYAVAYYEQKGFQKYYETDKYMIYVMES